MTRGLRHYAPSRIKSSLAACLAVPNVPSDLSSLSNASYSLPLAMMCPRQILSSNTENIAARGPSGRSCDRLAGAFAFLAFIVIDPGRQILGNGLLYQREIIVAPKYHGFHSEGHRATPLRRPGASPICF